MRPGVKPPRITFCSFIGSEHSLRAARLLAVQDPLAFAGLLSGELFWSIGRRAQKPSALLLISSVRCNVIGVTPQVTEKPEFIRW